MLKRLIVLLAAAMGMSLAVVTPVSAANGWQTYDMTTRDPVWSCETWEIQSALHMRTCVIHSSLGNAQAGVTVSNYTGSTKAITAPQVNLWKYNAVADRWDFVNTRECGVHSLLNKTSRACLAKTEGPYCHWMAAVGVVEVGGLRYVHSPRSVRVCGS